MIRHTGKEYKFLGFVIRKQPSGYWIARPKNNGEFTAFVFGWVKGPIAFFYRTGQSLHT